jgi:hypothetical protein
MDILKSLINLVGALRSAMESWKGAHGPPLNQNIMLPDLLRPTLSDACNFFRCVDQDGAGMAPIDTRDCA